MASSHEGTAHAHPFTRETTPAQQRILDKVDVPAPPRILQLDTLPSD